MELLFSRQEVMASIKGSGMRKWQGWDGSFGNILNGYMKTQLLLSLKVLLFP